eukprot:3080699-Rhodomonas_salina.3
MSRLSSVGHSLRAPYAKPGTDPAYGATSHSFGACTNISACQVPPYGALRWHSAALRRVRGTDASMVLHVRSTDVKYGATRAQY